MTAPVDPSVAGHEEHEEHDEGGHGLEITRRKVLAFAAFFLLAIVGLYLLIPQITGMDETWSKLQDGRPEWLFAAFVLSVVSYGGYVMTFQGVFTRAGARLDLRESYQITMAALAASRVFAAGGAGGIALQAWALRRAGLGKRTVADQSVAFLAITYVVYIVALLIGAVGLRAGLFPGPAPFGMTVAPAVFCVVAIAIAATISLVPGDLERRLQGWACRQGRVARIAQRLATIPAALSTGLHEAMHHARSRDPALLGALVYWAAQIGVLWAGFHAFGAAPPLAVLVTGFFVGMIGNLLPTPGGVGGVDAGMVGAFLAFGLAFDLVLVAVLTYRAFTFWLPTIPGIIAYVQLRKTVERWKVRPALA